MDRPEQTPAGEGLAPSFALAIGTHALCALALVAAPALPALGLSEEPPAARFEVALEPALAPGPSIDEVAIGARDAPTPPMLLPPAIPLAPSRRIRHVAPAPAVPRPPVVEETFVASGEGVDTVTDVPTPEVAATPVAVPLTNVRPAPAPVLPAARDIVTADPPAPRCDECVAGDWHAWMPGQAMWAGFDLRLRVERHGQVVSGSIWVRQRFNSSAGECADRVGLEIRYPIQGRVTADGWRIVSGRGTDMHVSCAEFSESAWSAAGLFRATLSVDPRRDELVGTVRVGMTQVDPVVFERARSRE